MIPVLLSKSTPSSSTCGPLAPPIPALPQQQGHQFLAPSSIPPPPLPPGRRSGVNKEQLANQSQHVSSSIRKPSENYYITSSMISRSSKDSLNKDQLMSSESINNLARLGQAARMRRCLSSTSPLSNVSTCSSASSSDHHVQDVEVDVHHAQDMINYTEIDHDKDDEKNVMNKKQSYLSQSQTSLSGSSSFFMDDDNWYSELIMSKPIKPLVMKSSDKNKYNNDNSNGTNNGSYNKVKRSSTFNSDDGLMTLPSTTPSPSDSGITDQLEGMLREKDSEIALLRETLEQNEQVIFKVYQEKEESWKKMYEKLRTQYESSLTMYQQEVVKCNHQLNSTIQQASSDRKRMEIEMEEYKSMNEFLQDRIGSMSKEITLLKTQLNTSEWTLRQKIQELSLLQSESIYENTNSKSPVNEQVNPNEKVNPNEQVNYETSGKNDDKLLIKQNDSQLKILIGQLNETKNIAESKSRSAIEMEEELKSSRIELSDFKETFGRSIKLLQEQTQELIEERRKKDSLIASLNEETIELRYQLGNLREELATTKEGFDEERANWKDEKERVIKYQKKLNSDYVKILKKNKELENELKLARNQYQIVKSSTVQC